MDRPTRPSRLLLPYVLQAKLPWFLQAQPSAACAKGGAGAYNDAVQVWVHRSVVQCMRAACLLVLR